MYPASLPSPVSIRGALAAPASESSSCLASNRCRSSFSANPLHNSDSSLQKYHHHGNQFREEIAMGITKFIN